MSVGRSEEPWTLGAVFRAYRWRILFTYGLFNLENLVRLAQPFVLGLAINGLLGSSGMAPGLALGVFVAQHVAYVAIGSWRRTYDTRAFTAIYADLATRLVLDQRRRQVEVSRIAARSVLSRQFVDFFERDVPLLVYSIYSVIGGLACLGCYDGLLVPCCLCLVLPAVLINAVYGRKTLLLNRHLNDQLEHEVGVIDGGGAAEVRGHYGLLARWRIKLSDCEAINFGVMELFILGLMAASLVRSCMIPGAAAGDIFAVFRYVVMFVAGLDAVPTLVQQVSRLRDIGRRVRPESPDSLPSAAAA